MLSLFFRKTSPTSSILGIKNVTFSKNLGMAIFKRLDTGNWTLKNLKSGVNNENKGTFSQVHFFHQYFTYISSIINIKEVTCIFHASSLMSG